MYRNLLSSFLFFLLQTAFLGQEISFEKFEKNVLITDLDSLANTVITTHQNPYTYCSSEDFTQALTLAKSQITDSLNSYEFAKIVSKFLSTLHDSHTYLDYGDLSKKYTLEKGRSIHIKVETIDNKLIVIKDSENLLPIGCSIDSINGVPIDEIQDKIKAYSISEGNSFHAHQRIADAIFATTLGYVLPINKENTFAITDDHGSKSIVYSVTPHGSKGTKKHKKRPPFTLKIDSLMEEQLATIKIASFSDKSNGKFNRFLRKSFRTIRQNKIEYVAIDLRDNLGGQIIRTNILMSYLTHNASYIPGVIIAKQSLLSKKMYRKKTSRLLLFFVKLLPFQNESLENFISQVNMKVGDVDTLYYTQAYLSQKNIFEGNSFLLINGLSGSASVLFASAYRKDVTGGLILGEPCLGPETGTWGNPVSYTLPNSGLRIFISSIRTNIDDSFVIDPTELKPDICVPRTIEDVKLNSDNCLDAIREIIRNQ